MNVPCCVRRFLNGLLSGLRPVSLNAGRDFVVVIFSIDPDEYSELAAAKKVNYVDGYGREGGENGWHFLTGDRASIDALTQAIGYRYIYDPETDEYVHASGIAILTPNGKIARYLFGVEFAPRDLQLGAFGSRARSDQFSNRCDFALLFSVQSINWQIYTGNLSVGSRCRCDYCNLYFSIYFYYGAPRAVAIAGELTPKK